MTSTRAPSVMHAQTTRTTGRAARGRLRGNDAARPPARARQAAASGQASQRGARGVQTSAPSSMTAWLKSPARRPGTSARPRACSAARVAGTSTGRRSSARRASTRIVLPSSANARASNAIAATAAAVYGPIPGSARSAASDAGIAPPWSATMAAAARRRLRARA